MKKFEATELGLLSAGNTFYFLGDKEHKVWSVAAKIPDSQKVFVKLMGNGRVKKVDATTQVVYLR